MTSRKTSAKSRNLVTRNLTAIFREVTREVTQFDGSFYRVLCVHEREQSIFLLSALCVRDSLREREKESEERNGGGVVCFFLVLYADQSIYIRIYIYIVNLFMYTTHEGDPA